MSELVTRLQRRLRFSQSEMKQILITVLFAAFVFSFRNWGGETFDLFSGAKNFILAGIITVVSLLVHFSAQKMIALHMGYSSTYSYWINGLLIGLFLCFFSYGFLPLFFTGSLFFDEIPKLRLGKFRGGVMTKDLGIIGVAGPIANIILVGFLAPLHMLFKHPIFFEMIKINLLIALFSLLPIPTFEKIRQFKGGTTGLYLFIASRTAFIIVFCAILAYTALILLFNIYSYIIAVAFGLLMLYVYSKYFPD